MPQDGEWFTFEANVNLSIPRGPLASEWFTFAANVNLSTPSPMVHSGGKREPCGLGCLGLAAQDAEWFTFEANVNLSIPGGPSGI